MKRTTESWSNALFSKRHKGDDESPLTEAEQDFESFSAHFAVPHAIGRVLQMRQAMNVRQLLLRSARDAWRSNDRCGRRSHGCTPQCRSVLTAWCLLTTLTADPPSSHYSSFPFKPPFSFPRYLLSLCTCRGTWLTGSARGSGGRPCARCTSVFTGPAAALLLASAACPLAALGCFPHDTNLTLSIL